jgi:hypothetical protein
MVIANIIYSEYGVAALAVVIAFELYVYRKGQADPAPECGYTLTQTVSHLDLLNLLSSQPNVYSRAPTELGHLDRLHANTLGVVRSTYTGFCRSEGNDTQRSNQPRLSMVSWVRKRLVAE